jgi:hypothetical protein
MKSTVGANETWKPMIGFEGIYEVSDLGQIKRLPRKWIAGKNQHRSIGESIVRQNELRGYMKVSLTKDGKEYSKQAHRLVWQSFNGITELEIDHINNIKNDNRLCNLQPLSKRDNTIKRSLLRPKTSKYTGVSKIKNRWQSTICINGKQKILGYFIDEYEAHLAYQKELNSLQ